MADQVQQAAEQPNTLVLAREFVAAAFPNIAEVGRVEQARLQGIKAFLASHTAEQASDALRGASKDERQAGQKLAPFIAVAIEKGISEPSARVYLSQYRAIVRAYYDPAVRMGIPDDMTDANKLYEMATERLGKQKRAQQLNAASINVGARQAHAAALLGIRLVDDNGNMANLTAEDYGRIRDKIAEMNDEDRKTAQRKEYLDAMRDAIDGCFAQWEMDAKNEKGETIRVPDRARNLQFARDVRDGLTTRINIAEAALAKANEGAAATAPAPAESMAGAMDRSTQVA